MAYEPGGGTGEPYSRYEDLNYNPGYNVQDWIRNMMRQGNVGVAPPMGTGMPDFEQDRMYGRTLPSDLQMPANPQDLIRQMLDQQQEEGNPNREPFPEEIDPYQVAGDVLPMRTHPPSISDVNMRLQTPGVGARSQGMQSIDRFGKDPRMIDLMDVLMGRFGK
jgi:hypothetical protein